MSHTSMYNIFCMVLYMLLVLQATNFLSFTNFSLSLVILFSTSFDFSEVASHVDNTIACEKKAKDALEENLQKEKKNNTLLIKLKSN